MRFRKILWYVAAPVNFFTPISCNFVHKCLFLQIFTFLLGYTIASFCVRNCCPGLVIITFEANVNHTERGSKYRINIYTL